MHIEPVQEIPAGLAEEDDEESAGRRLAARFVRPAAETVPAAPRRSMLGLKPFLAAGVFFVAAVCASAVYFSRSGPVVPVASAFAAAAVEGPAERSFATPEADAQEGEPSSAEAPAAAGNWAAALETFRMLARSQAAYAAHDKAEEPAQELLAGRSGANGPQ